MPDEDDIYDYGAKAKDRHQALASTIQAPPPWRQGVRLPLLPHRHPRSRPRRSRSSRLRRFRPRALNLFSQNHTPMARHRKYEAEEDAEPGLDISSLIDVCFLLLIYFLVTSTITPRESDLGMALPAANPSTEQPEIEPLFIRIEPRERSTPVPVPPKCRWTVIRACVICPCSKASWTLYSSAAKAANTKPLVQIRRWRGHATTRDRRAQRPCRRRHHFGHVHGPGRLIRGPPAFPIHPHSGIPRRCFPPPLRGGLDGLMTMIACL
jgi:biopolymer transport protein ExbD